MGGRIRLLFLGIFCSMSVWGQTDSITAHFLVIKAAEEDTVRLKYAEKIPDYLEKIAYGEYAQCSAVPYLGYKKCFNEEVELFSWSIPLQKGQMFYNWFRFKKGNQVYFLKSESGNPEQPAWLYYDLVKFEHGGDDYFVLLGWDRTRNTNRKIAQIARFKSNGSVTFNHKFMRRENSRSSSLSFEYASEGSMMLKQDKKGKRIIFDHLSPVEKKYEGYYMFYGPDGSYDALLLKGGEWWYRENVKQ